MPSSKFDTAVRAFSGDISRCRVLRSVGAAVAGLGITAVVGATRVPRVDAKERGVNTTVRVRDRLRGQRDMCEAGGGTLSVTKRPGGTTAKCVGGTEDGYVCVHSSNRTRCHRTRQGTPAPPDTAPIVPVNGGGGPDVPPDDPGGPIILFQ